jgi:hypothetical protein
MKGFTKHSEEHRQKAEEREKERSEFSINQATKKKKRKFLFSFIIILIIAVIAYFAVFARPSNAELDNFLSCLQDADVKFYGSFQCSACASQKRLFSNTKSIDKVYVECGPLGGPLTKECTGVGGIKAFPTWVFRDGTRIEGVTPLDTLSEKTGCVFGESLS